MIVLMTICSTFLNLQTYWLKLWTDTNSSAEKLNDFKYLGVFALFEFLALAFLMAFGYVVLITVVSKTGANLHDRLLTTVASASLVFFSTTDSGSTTNRFSQDMQLIDMQLPLGLLNAVFMVFFVTGQIVLVIASSPWVGVTFPIVFAVFYVVQKFYLRTSRQLRLLDLEAKSPLYTNFLETLSGLTTIRAFGWTRQNLALSRQLLDASQKPSYLLYMIQRWLTFVLDMVVAILATLIAALAVVRRANTGLTGIALTQVMVINMTLRMLILSWTEVETSIGAVSRIKNFSETTPSEYKLTENHEPTNEWPQHGANRIRGSHRDLRDGARPTRTGSSHPHHPSRREDWRVRPQRERQVISRPRPSAHAGDPERLDQDRWAGSATHATYDGSRARERHPAGCTLSSGDGAREPRSAW